MRPPPILTPRKTITVRMRKNRANALQKEILAMRGLSNALRELEALQIAPARTGKRKRSSLETGQVVAAERVIKKARLTAVLMGVARTPPRVASAVLRLAGSSVGALLKLRKEHPELFWVTFTLISGSYPAFRAGRRAEQGTQIGNYGLDF